MMSVTLGFWLSIGSCLAGFGFGCLAAWRPAPDETPARPPVLAVVPVPLPVAGRLPAEPPWPALTFSEIAQQADAIGREIDTWKWETP
jgi:hypothetical protein